MIAVTHPVAPEEVMAFLDGEVSPEQARFVSVHIAQCEECATMAAGLHDISKTLSSSCSVEAVPEGLAQRVTELARKVRSGVNVEPASLFVRLSFWSSKHWAVAASATAVVLLLVAAISISNRTRSSMPQHMAAAYRPLNSREGLTLSPQGASNRLTLETLQQAREHYENALALKQREAISSSLAVDGPPSVPENPPAAPPPPTSPMIAHTVSVSIVVNDFAASRANLDAILHRHHAYAAELTANTVENAPRTLEASLRIPAPELDAVVADLKALGRVEKETRTGEEVTQQHADVLARLKNSRETEHRLQAILEQRTGKISDVLQVEQEIARVRGEIEQMEAAQKSLEHRIEFATVNLSLAEEYKAQLLIPAMSAGTRLHNALVEGYRNASETVLGMVLFFAEYSLTLLIWALLLLLPAFLLWRRFRRALASV